MGKSNPPDITGRETLRKMRFVDNPTMENIMNKFTTIFLAASVVGCAATVLSPGAESVRVSNSEPGEECKYLGDVTGSQGNFFTGPYTSNENLETGARNELKNKAFAMGGNLVVILTQRAGQTGSGPYGGGQQTNVTITGNVYHCTDHRQ